ncbi:MULTISPECIES: hypothetical protein [unclassified Cytobacillus]|uniref:hypothetical protein n=1 Tax=unclassified Cytobacillus TaxID=2675268 RepID=UPI0020426B4D|nr:hypothetical protein [Cytobacillus sp. AMY 15.2]MCM3090183.1 hypothetical protein [Cytobacillus sp. AMY 15.2]
MKQLDLFSFAIEDQIAELKQGEELEFNRGRERLLIRKHKNYKGAYLYEGPDFSGYALHVNEKGIFGGFNTFVAKIVRWVKNGSWNEAK